MKINEFLCMTPLFSWWWRGRGSFDSWFIKLVKIVHVWRSSKQILNFILPLLKITKTQVLRIGTSLKIVRMVWGSREGREKTITNNFFQDLALIVTKYQSMATFVQKFNFPACKWLICPSDFSGFLHQATNQRLWTILLRKIMKKNEEGPAAIYSRAFEAS